MKVPIPKSWMRTAWLGLALFLNAGTSAIAQTTAAPAAESTNPASTTNTEEEEVLVLTPFVVDASEDRGYQAVETLSGTRLRTNLADVGSSITVMTEAFLRDLNATNNQSVLAYVANAEIGGARGNFSGGFPEVGNETYEGGLLANPNANTRIRGLTSADNTRNYFITDLPWDGYTVSRVDLLRGPNAILFGLGSPAGIINVTTNPAQPWNRGTLGYTVDKHGSQRWTLDVNRTFFDKQLLVRATILRNEQQFQQRPAFNDDNRYYGTFSFKPKALNRPGFTFDLSGNYEKGSINANRPRITPPVDQLTAWWKPAAQGGLDKQVFDPIKDRARTEDSNVLNNPAVGSYRSNNGIYYDAERGTLQTRQPLNNLGALRPDGTMITDLNSSGGPFPQPANYGFAYVPNTMQGWAVEKGLPFVGVGSYKRAMITDPSIFNFYETLIDGNTKGESADWTVFDASLSQTFLNQKLGYNATIFQQRLDQGQFAALGWSNLLLMDIESHQLNGAPNPNVGRPFVAEEFREGSSYTYKSDRDAWRVQGFATHDFSKGSTGFLMRLLGEHRLTATMSEEKQKTDFRFRQAWSLDPVTKQKLSGTVVLEGPNVLYSGFRQYLGGSLLNRTSPAGANIPGIPGNFFPGTGGPVKVTYFNNTWTADSSVNPGAAWIPPDPNVTSASDVRRTQSANPANYQGWTTIDADLITINSNHTVNGLSARDYLTNVAELKKFDVKSQAFAWQGFLWDKSIVGLYGYRKDKANSFNYQSSYRAGTGRPDGGANVASSSYNYDNASAKRDNIEAISRNYSVALHVNRLLGKHDFLPVNVSLYYNKATNFQPFAGRRDINSIIIPPPKGLTEEYSVLLSTKDSKYSMRVTKYETSVTLANSTGSVGNLWGLEQSLAALGEGGSPAGILRGFRSGARPLSEYSSDPALQAKLVNSIMPAWFAFEKELKEKFPDYVNGWMGADTVWGTDSNVTTGIRSTAPVGFVYTEDNKSKGYEIEFTANPTPNWRLGGNVSKTEVMRDNVPGKGFLEVAKFIDDKFMNTDAGLAPVWWSGNTFGLRVVGPYAIYRGDYQNIITLNGRSNPEVRKYRFNLYTSYDFTEGRLKGFGVGSGYRWEDKSVIGYAPKKLVGGTETSTNLDAPVYAPANNTFDLWLSYRRKLTDKIDWRIQLNVDNVFGENELVPISAGVDPFKIATMGTINDKSVIPMVATSYYIREGRSWSISSTFEF